MTKLGTRKMVEYEYRQKECEDCAKPAMHKLTFLLEGGRRNPASRAYGEDDCSRCSDLDRFACTECKERMERYPPDGYTWCSDFYVKKNDDGTFSNLDRVCDWEKTSETIVETTTL